MISYIKNITRFTSKCRNLFLHPISPKQLQSNNESFIKHISTPNTVPIEISFEIPKINNLVNHSNSFGKWKLQVIIIDIDFSKRGIVNDIMALDHSFSQNELDVINQLTNMGIKVGSTKYFNKNFIQNNSTFIWWNNINKIKIHPHTILKVDDTPDAIKNSLDAGFWTASINNNNNNDTPPCTCTSNTSTCVPHYKANSIMDLPDIVNDINDKLSKY